MKLKDIAQSLVPTKTKQFDITKINHQIKNLRRKRSQEELANQLRNSDKKYVVILGKQLDSDLCTLWSKNKDYHNTFEIADGYVESIVKNNDPIYDYIFTSSQLKLLYESITDRKLRLVTKQATFTLKEFILRIYKDIKNSQKRG